MKVPIVLALVLVSAGCLALKPAALAPGATPQGWDAIERAIGAPVGSDHDHQDGKLHNASLNLARLAIATGHDGAPPAGEFYAETAIRDGYAYLTRYGPESGLVIFDVKDVAKPKLVSSIRLDEGFEPDVEISADGKWAFWETQRFPISVTTPSPDPGANAPHGVHIVDISDKANPKWAGFYPVTPDGPHSITYAKMAGKDVVFLSTYAFAYAYGNVEVPGQQRLVITELDASGPIATLKELATYVEPDGPDAAMHYFPHDVSVSVHPVTGKTLAYVGYWDNGVVTLDVTDPAHPKKVSQFTDFGPAKYRAVHMARQFETLVDGKVVVAIEPEIGGAKDSGYMTFADFTDPAHPKYLSSWILPGNVTSQGLRFSPHYFDVLDGRVALASYHAGVWVIDAHDAANLAHPRSAAFALVAADHPTQTVFGTSSEGSAFDAWWLDATHVLVGDSANGLAVYRYDGPTPASG